MEFKIGEKYPVGKLPAGSIYEIWGGLSKFQIVSHHHHTTTIKGCHTGIVGTISSGHVRRLVFLPKSKDEHVNSLRDKYPEAF